MKKTLLFCMSMFYVFFVFGQGSVTSDPSPLLSSKGGKITIDVSGTSVSGDVYLYSWAVVNNVDKAATSWTGSINSKYKMTSEGSNKYSYTIENLQEFFSLTDDDLLLFTKVGVIARTQGGAQTADLFITVEQAPKVVYSGGEGTIAEPYLLGTAEDFVNLSSNTSDWGAVFQMTADITLSDDFAGIGTAGTPFSGTFDGNGHSIVGLKMNGSGNATGLFPYVNNATIRLLAIPDAQITGTIYVGALVGKLISGTIERCYTAGTVNGNGICVGGFVGSNEGGLISNCYSTCSVNNTSDNATGGFAGKNSGTIQNAYATGSVNGHEFVGGFIGANYSSVKNSAAINNPMSSGKQYVARFGGNNNSENNSDNNISWACIRINANNEWTESGDHATHKNAETLSSFECFNSTLNWDFPTTWIWHEDSYPLLAGISTQSATYPTVFEDFIITGIEEQNTDIEISVYPNPVSNDLYVNTNGRTEAILVNMFDITGKIVVNTFVTSGNSHVDLSQLQNGIYILKAYTDNNELITVTKIIKK